MAKKVGTTVAGATTQTISAVGQRAVAVGKGVANAAVATGNVVKKVATVGYDIVTGKPKFDAGFGLNNDPVVQIDTPWGSANGVTIFSTAEADKIKPGQGRNGLTRTAEGAFHIYCVSCKAKGRAAVGGELNYQICTPRVVVPVRCMLTINSAEASHDQGGSLHER